MDKTTITRVSDVYVGLNPFNGRRERMRLHPNDAGYLIAVGRKCIKPTLDNTFEYRPLRWLRIPSTVGCETDGSTAYHFEHILGKAYGCNVTGLSIELPDGNVVPRFTPKVSYEIMNFLLHNITLGTENVYKIATSFSTSRKSTDRITCNVSDAFSVTSSVTYPYRAIGCKEKKLTLDSLDLTDVLISKPIFFVPHRFLWKIIPKSLHGIRVENTLLVGNPKDSCYIDKTRDPHAFINHKLLDHLGSLALLGKRFVEGEFNFYATGHQTELDMLEELSHVRGVIQEYQYVSKN